MSLEGSLPTHERPPLPPEERFNFESRTEAVETGTETGVFLTERQYGHISDTDHYCRYHGARAEYENGELGTTHPENVIMTLRELTRRLAEQLNLEDWEVELAPLLGAWHDEHLAFELKPNPYNEFVEERKRIPVKSELISAFHLVEWMEKVNQNHSEEPFFRGVEEIKELLQPYLEVEDINQLKAAVPQLMSRLREINQSQQKSSASVSAEAILTTIPGFQDGTVVQPYLARDSHPLAKLLAITDINSSGKPNSQQYLREGTWLFVEDQAHPLVDALLNSEASIEDLTDLDKIFDYLGEINGDAKLERAIHTEQFDFLGHNFNKWLLSQVTFAQNRGKRFHEVELPMLEFPEEVTRILREELFPRENFNNNAEAAKERAEHVAQIKNPALLLREIGIHILKKNKDEEGQFSRLIS